MAPRTICTLLALAAVAATAAAVTETTQTTQTQVPFAHVGGASASAGANAGRTAAAVTPPPLSCGERELGMPLWAFILRCYARETAAAVATALSADRAAAPLPQSSPRAIDDGDALALAAATAASRRRRVHEATAQSDATDNDGGQALPLPARVTATRPVTPSLRGNHGGRVVDA